jgi:hypothetical protein
MFLCLNLAAGEARESVGKPDRSLNQAGHWHSSVHHRRSQSPQNTVEDNSIVVAAVISDVVLRTGPGADFGAIGHLPRGTELETTDCIGGWYRVEFNGIALSALPIPGMTRPLPFARRGVRMALPRRCYPDLALRQSPKWDRQHWQDSSPRCQMQKLSARNFHDSVLSHFDRAA